MENYDSDIALKDFEPVQQAGSAIQITKFKNLARSKFQDAVKYEKSFSDFARENSKYNLSIIPLEYNEIFVHYKQAEYYWINESPLLLLVETLIKNTGNKNFIFDNNYREVKNFYTKWAIQKSPKEKQYFALSAINLVERSINNTNFINYILSGIIRALEPSVSDLDKSQADFDRSRQILEVTAFNDRQRGMFIYLINLFQGIIYLRLGQYDQALSKFGESQSNKTGGMTAVIYAGLIANKLGDYSGAVSILDDVVAFDKQRIQYAIENKSIPLFNYFLNSAFTYNVLAELEFANLCEDIDALIDSHFVQNGYPLGRINSMINSIITGSYQEYINQNIKKQIEFVINMSNQFSNNPNVITMVMGTYLLSRVQEIINNIIENIKKKHYDKINVELSLYEHEIAELNSKMNGTDGSLNEIKSSYERGMNDVIKAIESQTEYTITNIEKQIENIENNEKFSPATSFSNSLFYAVLISIVVFIVFGFTGGFWQAKEIDSNYMGMMTDVFAIGIRWGSGTFVIGLIFSFFSAASAGWEKATEKQRLLKSISLYNNYKEKQIEQVRKDTKAKIEYYMNKQKESVRDINERISKLKNERATQETAMKQLAEDEIKKLSSDLVGMLESV
ncbi:MAG: hypothetical protein GXX85_08400 [Ignavibacteria bacterium]|nr:hypothetical protein [Ignavibacteria bacterium]